MSLFGKNLAFIRKAKGLKQAQMADVIEVQRHTWSDYETGRSEPNISALVCISEFFQIPVDILISQDLSLIEDLESVKNTKNKKSPDGLNREGVQIAEDSIVEYHVRETIESKNRIIESQKEVIETQKTLINALNSNISMLSQRVKELEKGNK